MEIFNASRDTKPFLIKIKIVIGAYHTRTKGSDCRARICRTGYASFVIENSLPDSKYSRSAIWNG
jgi:hypothetical protein